MLKVRVEYVRPFIVAAMDVLQAELGTAVTRGVLSTDSNHFTNREISVLIGLSGEVVGSVLYGMSRLVAISIAEVMIGEKLSTFGELAESAIAELGNMISGRASVLYEQKGVYCNISPPTVVVGRGTRINTVGFPRLIAPLETDLGQIEIVVSLQLKN